MLGPRIGGKSCSLRQVREDDLPLLQRYQADERVTRHTGHRLPRSTDDQREWLQGRAADPNGVTWTIEVDHRPIGTAAIFAIDWINGHAYTSIMIGDPSYWGRGIGTEAVAMRSAFAFSELRLHKLRTQVSVENVGMLRVLERAGFRAIGLAREDRFYDGTWHDVWLGELVAQDWVAARPKAQEGPDVVHSQRAIDAGS